MTADRYEAGRKRYQDRMAMLKRAQKTACCPDMSDSYVDAGGSDPGIDPKTGEIRACDGETSAIKFCPWCGKPWVAFADETP